MLDEIKKEFSSTKLLTGLLILAVLIYLFQFLSGFLREFSDIILILVFGWLVSFILEPFVDFFSDRLKIPRVLSTVIVFILSAILIILTFALFIPDIISQFNTLEKISPQFLKVFPPQVQKSLAKPLDSLGDFALFIPSVTQFVINLITVLILSFYIVVDRDNINRRIFTMTPTKYHEFIRFCQRVVNKSFASFVRVQVLWGAIGGVVTWIVLTIFGVNFAASTSLLSGVLTSVPVIGPIIGVAPPLFVTLIDKPDQAVIIFLLIFIIQQFIFNVFGPKVIGKAFNINPVIVILSLLIGIKIAGFTGAVFAIPVISIILIVGRELYRDFKEDEK